MGLILQFGSGGGTFFGFLTRFFGTWPFPMEAGFTLAPDVQGWFKVGHPVPMKYPR